ncbi:MAG TPA: RNA polymerase sigma factor [Bryobacteraceae bacterium]|nr:RNA polymerase sigma factor [Bryobacteraceae bacterium]
MTEQTDDALMGQVKEGEVDQLAVLFERHHRLLFRFFYHLVGSSVLAEDLTQEVFFRMLKFRQTFQQGARFSPWMYQIARNVHVDQMRKKQIAMPMWDERADRDMEPADPGASPEWSMMRGSDLAILRRALMRLPPERRELLVLSRWQNLRYDEIAAIVQCDVSVVKSRMFRAMKQLSEIFFRLSGRKAS